MRLERALNIEDLRGMARSRLPRILFELIESGVSDEHGLERNRQAFRDYTFLPRYLTQIAERQQSVTLFGRQYDSPFGIAPTGFAALLRHDADLMLAGAARQANIPFILSGASASPIERVVEMAPDYVWYHLYPAKDRSITGAILRRIEAAGISMLVLTVDNPVYPARERDARNGFSLPLRLRLPILLEALTHPAWIAHYYCNGGMPVMDTWAPFAGKNRSAAEVAAFFRQQSPSIQTWDDVREMRQQWRGRFILKGIQHPEDALLAQAAGIDGIVVSNHGAKSFDALPSPLSTLPAIRAAVGPDYPLMMDSGIRRGHEAMVARCLGADFVFVGRATLYGVVAAARPGADHAISILRHQIDQGLAMVGCARFVDLDAGYLMKHGQCTSITGNDMKASQEKP
jgi:isopentenyl diphosphate isomerase/L-lactate dehydrogenase-like FMN-dependent dehydrogenase